MVQVPPSKLFREGGKYLQDFEILRRHILKYNEFWGKIISFCGVSIYKRNEQWKLSSGFLISYLLVLFLRRGEQKNFFRLGAHTPAWNPSIESSRNRQLL